MPRKRATKRKAEEAKQEEDMEIASDPETKDGDASSSTKGAPETALEESHNGQNAHVEVPIGSRKGGLESDASANVSEDSDAAEPQYNGSINGSHMDALREQEEDEEEEEEEILVVLELADFKNHPILDDYQSITVEGLDTAKPTLHIGEYSLHGQLEETVGTHFFYDTKNRTEKNEYRYTGQTTKKIKFTIAPPDEYH